MTELQVWELLRRIIAFPSSQICKHHVASDILSVLQTNDVALAEAIVNANDERALELLDQKIRLTSVQHEV